MILPYLLKPEDWKVLAPGIYATLAFARDLITHSLPGRMELLKGVRVRMRRDNVRGSERERVTG